MVLTLASREGKGDGREFHWSMVISTSDSASTKLIVGVYVKSKANETIYQKIKNLIRK